MRLELVSGTESVEVAVAKRTGIDNAYRFEFGGEVVTLTLAQIEILGKALVAFCRKEKG